MTFTNRYDNLILLFPILFLSFSKAKKIARARNWCYKFALVFQIYTGVTWTLHSFLAFLVNQNRVTFSRVFMIIYITLSVKYP